MQNPATSPVPAVFCFESHNIRTVGKDGEVWFALKDVCSVLTIGNSSDVSRRLDDDEKGVEVIDTPSGAQETVIINESGLYSVIMRSQKPEAKRFKKWVTSEVLPAIRKTGSYSVAYIPALPTNPVEYLLMVADAIRDQQNRTDQIETMVLETAVKVDEIAATKRLEDWQRFELKNAVDHKVAKLKLETTTSTPTLYRRIWGFVKNQFRVSTYSAIPASKFDEARVVIDKCTTAQIGM